MPIPRPDLWVFFSLFFGEKFWSKVGHILPKILTDEKSDKKQNPTGEVFAMARINSKTCENPNFHDLSRKNGVDIRRGIKLGFST